MRWVFVEAADVIYASQNPERVTAEGLSTDGTSSFLRGLAERDSRVTSIAHGFSRHAKAEVGKVEARQRTLEIAAEVKPDFVVVLDADEFYTKEDQGRLLSVMCAFGSGRCFTFPKREIWRPPSLSDRPLFSFEAVGGFWGIPCCHWFRWKPGIHYDDCHNTPKDGKGCYLNHRLLQLHDRPEMPQMIHLGFAASRESRLAKHAYYAARGEALDRQRQWYVDSRSRWERWKLGDGLPRGARVVEYTGPVPEVFCEK